MSESEPSLLPPLDQPAPPAPPSAPPAPPAVEDLQFQRAEFGDAPGTRCAYCKGDAGQSYYRVGGAVACHACTMRLSDLQIRPDRKTFWLRAAPWGLGAAVAGSILFALISLTGFQFAVVAIVVGYMVGKAIRRATGGRSSRACQVLAVVLTYGAITTSYLPFVVSGVVKKMSSDAKAMKTTATPLPALRRPPASLGRALVGVAIGGALLIGVSLVIPILMVATSPVSGLINLVIIFVGLRKAWQLTAPFSAPITGPFPAA